MYGRSIISGGGSLLNNAGEVLIEILNGLVAAWNHNQTGTMETLGDHFIANASESVASAAVPIEEEGWFGYDDWRSVLL